LLKAGGIAGAEPTFVRLNREGPSFAVAAALRIQTQIELESRHPKCVA
jgi:hypothetical protein